MSINEYLLRLESIINSSPIITSSKVTIDRKTADIAFISGLIEFRNGAVLDFKEFIESLGPVVEKYKYAYNYRIGSNTLFRYDNAPDPNARMVITYPHHKHLEDGSVRESEPKDMSAVLEEIEKAVSLDSK